ncbi:MAG: DUF2946 family protein [Limnohabitans sp.]
MDDLVRQAMAKWPHVPDCYGWLALDARGQWWMRDDRTQALGAFQSGLTAARGSLLQHRKLIDFIERNYEADAQGCWYFQNGPQRVFVELESTPLVWRLDDHGQACAHTGQRSAVTAALLDEAGHVYLHTPIGLGRVHTLDMHLAADCIERGLWPLQDCRAGELPQRFGFVCSPELLRGGQAKGAADART